ncbi:DUF5036 family protein [uncultured Alistipes sp.]|uniref:DUF5036 family protein n=1 Tax=uncultured Alistipes sp. TaxID=538949 RepID=UPI002805ABFD|nr:DUF5036 family protein [uncultured Alistipes sp.]
MKKFLLPLLAAALACTKLSCSKKEGNPADPAGTAMLNMYNEQNGKTILSDSDIYINDAGNFISPSSCQLFVLGQSSGLGGVRISDLDTVPNSVSGE